MSDSLQPHKLSPPGSSVHKILQARVLEWVAILSLGDLPNPGTEPGSPALQADSLPLEQPESPFFLELALFGLKCILLEMRFPLGKRAK